MKKRTSNLLSTRIEEIILAVVFVIILSVIWGIILAEDSPSSLGGINTNTTPSTYTTSTSTTSGISGGSGTGSTTTRTTSTTTTSSSGGDTGSTTTYTPMTTDTVSNTSGTDSTNTPTTTTVPTTTTTTTTSSTSSGSSTEPSSSTQLTTTKTIPLAPENLSLNGSPTSTYIPLKWTNKAANVYGFSISRKSSDESSWSNLAEIKRASAVSYYDNTVVAGRTYDYRIKACYPEIGCSEYAYLHKVTTPHDSIVSFQGATGTEFASGTKGTTAGIDPTTTTTVAPTPLINDSSLKIQNLGIVVEDHQDVVDDSREELEKIINQSVTKIIENNEGSSQETDTTKINALRDELLENVDESLSTEAIVTPTDIKELETEMNEAIKYIELVTSESTTISKTATNDTDLEDVAEALDLLSEAVSNQSLPLKRQEADLLYKDSNSDGISDYDSIYVYNINPVAPSPVSTYEGKDIGASEKVLLGFDPAKTELVKIEKEEPVESGALTVLTYKVKEMTLTEEKKVVIKGQALPNSFVTLYIYSTPIIVTVKTDERGEWQYILDKELENGDHTIYTATVNNSGNIIAKSSPYLFTKTAEAVTLLDTNIAEAASADKPGLLKNDNLYVVVVIVVVIIMMILTLVGITSKRNKEGI